MNPMNPETFRELLEKCLEGTATPEEQDRVAQACQAQPEFARILDEALAMDASLQALRHDTERFASALLARITRKGESSRFAQAVRGQLEPGAPEQPDTSNQAPDATGLNPDIKFATGIQKFVRERKSSKRMRKASSRRATSWPWLPVLAAACVLVGVTLYLTVFDPKDPMIDVGQKSEPIGEVVWVRELTKDEIALVLVRNVDGTAKERELKVNDPLYAGDRLKTQEYASDAPAARAAIRMRDGTEVDLADATTLTVAAPAELELEAGRIYVDASGPFRVQTELAGVEVEEKGAKLDLLAGPDQARLRLKAGSVQWSNSFGRRRLKAMEESTVTKGQGPSEPVVAVADWPARREPANPASSSSLTDGLVGFWRFDEGQGELAADSSGRGHPGRLVNGPRWTQGRIGGALDFDGRRTSVNLGSPAVLDNLDSFTFAAWIKPRSTGKGGFGVILIKGTHKGPSKRFLVNAPEGGLELAVSCREGSAQACSAQGTLELNTWQWLVATYSPADGSRLYKNGVEIEYSRRTRNAGEEPDDAAHDLVIGCWPDETRTGFFDGLIDELRIYNRALSAPEIKALHDQSAER